MKCAYHIIYLQGSPLYLTFSELTISTCPLTLSPSWNTPCSLSKMISNLSTWPMADCNNVWTIVQQYNTSSSRGPTKSKAFFNSDESNVWSMPKFQLAETIVVNTIALFLVRVVLFLCEKQISWCRNWLMKDIVSVPDDSRKAWNIETALNTSYVGWWWLA